MIKAIYDLMRELNTPLTISECGIDKNEFFAVADELAEQAFEDQCTTANPRMPLIEELAQIYRDAYDTVIE